MKIFDGILLLSDLDGTLLYDTKLPPENAEAIRYFQENGGLFSVATGRAADFIKKYPFTPNAPIITINGTVIYDCKTGKVIKEYFMHPDCKKAACYAVTNYDLIRMSIYSAKENYISDPSISDIEEFSKPVHKMVFAMKSEEDALRLRRDLSKDYGDKFRFERSWPTGLEMCPIDSGKGLCVDILRAMTGAKTVVCAGDYENDFSLLAAADISYATANAHPDIIAAADRKTVHCKDAAIAHIIHELEKELRKD